MTTATFKRWALLCLLPILALVAKGASVGIVITAAGLANSSGSALPDNRLVQLVANTAGQSFGTPTVSAFVSGTDVVLASFPLNSSTTGVAGSFQIYLTVDRSLFAGLSSGAPLLLRWYDTPYVVGQTAPGAATYGQFTTGAIVDGSTSGWTLPADGQNASLNVVTVSNGGSQLDTLGRAALTVLPDAPTVASVNPASGPAAGGTTVTLTGTNLTGATGVSFGGTAGFGIVVNSATSITVTSPAAAAGVVDITVTTFGGTSATAVADQFTFVAAPTVASLTPSAGTIAGGTSVTLNGTNLTGATAVRFGTTAATYTVTSATSITATSPAGGVGNASVTVTTIGGTSAGSPFTYLTVPTVVSPTSTAIASTSATLGGQVSTDGGAAITERGVVFSLTSTNANPQLNGTGVSKLTASGTTGPFTVSPTGLGSASTYTYAAYATNSIGTSYSPTSTFTTNPLAPLITAASSASGTYGSAISPFTITAAPTPTSYSATGLPPGLSIDLATGQITGTPTSAAGSPFNVTLGATNAGGTGTATLMFTVAKAALTVTADAQTKVYGAATPTLTATFTGFVNGQNLATSGITGSAAVTTTATATTPVGSAPLTPAVGSLVSANYAFTTFTDGSLTITNAPLTVTADTQTKVYGAANPALTATISGFVNGETLATSGVSGSPLLATAATLATGVSTPAITVALGSLTAANYAFTTLTDSTLTITKAPLTVAADAQTKVYGTANPALTATIFGFVNGETLATSGITGSAAVTTTATETTPVGSIPLSPTVGSLVAANYAFTTFSAGILTITPAPVTIALNNLTHVYSANSNSATATVTPAVPVTLVYSTANGGAPVNAGSYTVTATITDPNYSGSATATLVVAKATQTLAFTLTGTNFTVGSTLGLNATASSGLPVTFALEAGTASLSGSTLVITTAGATTVRATQAGGSNHHPATADQSFTGGAAQKTAQTLVFAQPANQTLGDAPFGLSASATSGLPVTFTVVEGPATISAGNLVTLVGNAGIVTIRAAQAGDATFAAAPAVTRSFIVMGRGIAIAETFFGDLVDDTGLFGDDGRGELVASSGPRLFAKAGDIAAVYYPDSRRGTMLLVASSLNLNVSLEFVLSNDNTYVVPFVSEGRSLTLTGTLNATTLTGRLTALRVGFRTQVQSRAGSTQAIAGYYQSNSVNSSDGGTSTIVGSDGQLLIVVKTSTVTTGAVGTVAANGTFAIAAPGATIAGSVDAASTSVTGTIVSADQSSVSFSGIAATTARTDRLINLSSRVRIAPAASRTLITGFVIGGTEAKRVLLRAVGPTLTGFGVTDALVNPRLQLFDAAGQVLLENDDWSGAEDAAAFARTGAFALSPGTKDAALLTTLAPGAYTMQITAGNETGVALAEIYDASTTTGTEAQRLVNLSTRGTVDTGDGLLIGGFVVTGNTPKRVLVRGIGPALAAFGVADTLTDPRLSVYQGSTLIAQNDDWSAPTPLNAQQSVATATQLTAAAQSVGAFALTVGTKDAALIITLAPGAYTAQVAGPGTTTGVALVEVYELP